MTGPNNNNIKSLRIGVAGGEPCPPEADKPLMPEFGSLV